MFVLQPCLRAACGSVAPHPCNQLNAKDADMEQVLLLCYVTTKVLMKCCLVVIQLQQRTNTIKIPKSNNDGYSKFYSHSDLEWTCSETC